MKSAEKPVGWLEAIAGVGGVLLLACTACCLPLMAPVLAWLGIALLPLMGWYGVAAAGLLAAVVGVLTMRRWRRRRHGPAAGQCPDTGSKACECSGKSA